MYYHNIYFVFDTTHNNVQNEHTKIIEKYIANNCENLEYLFWSFDMAIKFVEEHYPFFLPLFKAQLDQKIVLCDFFRYLLMYHYGGVYTDLDFIVIRPFETFLQKLNKQELCYYPNTVRNPSIILTEEWLDSTKISETLHNGILISLKPFHPFWMKLMIEIYSDIIVKQKTVKSHNDVYTTTGPKKLLKFYQENLNFFSDVCILPYYYFCPFVAIEYDKETGDKKTKIYNNAVVSSPEDFNFQKTNWVFFNIDDHQQLFDVCPNSFFVCVFLNTGSMWK